MEATQEHNGSFWLSVQWNVASKRGPHQPSVAFLQVHVTQTFVLWSPYVCAEYSKSACIRIPASAVLSLLSNSCIHIQE